MNEASKNLGHFLREARQRKQLTLRAVESATAISNAYLSQLESGRIRQPSPTLLHKLSELYEVSYADAMRHAGYPVPGDERSGKAPRPLGRFVDITPEEEVALSEYLDFLRSRHRRGPR